MPPGADAPVYAPSQRLDFELELGFVVGVPSALGKPVPAERFADHVFGVVLVNDWSARDIQAWEYVPLGPFLGKSFQTSISAWVTPLALLDERRVEAPQQEPPALEHLAGGRDWALDIDLEVELNGEDDLARERSHSLLDDAATARARDLERGVASDRRSHGHRHDLGASRRLGGLADRADPQHLVPRRRRRGRSPRQGG